MKEPVVYEEIAKDRLMTDLKDDIQAMHNHLEHLYFLLGILKHWDELLKRNQLEESKNLVIEMRLIFLQAFILKFTQLMEYQSKQVHSLSYITFLRRLEKVMWIEKNTKKLCREQNDQKIFCEVEEEILKKWVHLETFHFHDSSFEAEQKKIMNQLLTEILSPNLFEQFAVMRRLRNKWAAHIEKDYQAFRGETVSTEHLEFLLDRIKDHLTNVLAEYTRAPYTLKHLKLRALDNAKKVWKMEA